MTDPTRYIRKDFIDAFNSPAFPFYGQVPPGSAVTPYAVVTVSLQQRAIKNLTAYNITTTVTMYHEFREFGGRKIIDEKTDQLLTALIQPDGTTLPLTGFNHVQCTMSGIDERVEESNSLSIFIKTIRFNSLVTE